MSTLWQWTRDNGALEPWLNEVTHGLYLRWYWGQWIVGIEYYPQANTHSVTFAVGPLTFEVFWS